MESSSSTDKAVAAAGVVANAAAAVATESSASSSAVSLASGANASASSASATASSSSAGGGGGLSDEEHLNSLLGGDKSAADGNNAAAAAIATTSASSSATSWASAASEPSPSWRWMNTSQALLCVADVTPECDDEQLPMHLAGCFKRLQAIQQRPSQSDILIGLVYSIALECGFCTIETTTPTTTEPPPPSVTWWSSFNARFVRHFAASLPADAGYDYDNDCYTMRLSLRGLCERECLLHGRQLGVGMLLVSLNARDLGVAGAALCMPIAEFVVRPQLLRTAGATKCVKNVARLAERLRDGLFGPVRGALLADEDRPWAGLLGVPDAVREHVYGMLAMRDLQACAALCRQTRVEVLELARVRKVTGEL